VLSWVLTVGWETALTALAVLATATVFGELGLGSGPVTKIVALVVVAALIVVLDNSVLTVAIPTILRDFDTTLPAVEWVITGYALTFASLLIIGGRLADVFGQRRIFVIGAALFGGGSLLAAFSWNIPSLIVGEAIIEGIGASLMLPATLAILSSTFRGRERAAAFAAWGATAGVAAAAGPVVGGFLTTNYSWRWSFRINVIIAPLAIIGALVFMKRGERSDRRVAIDIPGALLVATGNGEWNGRRYWGDSLLRLSGNASRLLGSWTPADQQQLDDADVDLGSTSPALLGGGLALQGGKDGKLRLLDLRRLSLGRLGGELQTVTAPGGADVFTTPAVWRASGRTWVFVGTNAGLGAWTLDSGRLHRAWSNGNGSTSPVIAGGLLYAYDPDGGLRVYDPQSGRQLAVLPAGGGHWNSPIVADGRVALPEGNANAHSLHGVLDVYRARG
jgi:MFS family permease